MPQNRWRPGLRPGPRWGELKRSPKPPSRNARGFAPRARALRASSH